MYVCMYVCMYVRTYVRTYVRRTYVCMYVHVRTYVRMHVCMYVCMYVCMCVYLYVRTYVCMCVHLYVCSFILSHMFSWFIIWLLHTKLHSISVILISILFWNTLIFLWVAWYVHLSPIITPWREVGGVSLRVPGMYLLISSLLLCMVWPSS